jgi:hypothetical protein
MEGLHNGLVSDTLSVLNKNHPLSRGLVGYYSFRESVGTNNAVIQDLSGNNNNGIIFNTGGFPIPSPTPFGMGLNMGGVNTSRVQCGKDKTIQITGALSLSTWVNWTSFPTGSSGTWQALVSKSNGDHNNAASTQYSLITYNTMTLGFVAGSDGMTNNFLNLTHTSEYTFTLGLWYNIVGTWDGTLNTGGMKIYINGRLIKQGNASVLNCTNKDSNLHIGKSSEAGFGVALNGIQGDTRIYNRPLTPTEIQQLYNNPRIDWMNKNII